jgi:hypothetical protein
VRCVAFVNEEAPFFFRGDMGSGCAGIAFA